MHLSHNVGNGETGIRSGEIWGGDPAQIRGAKGGGGVKTGREERSIMFFVVDLSSTL